MPPERCRSGSRRAARASVPSAARVSVCSSWLWRRGGAFEGRRRLTAHVFERLACRVDLVAQRGGLRLRLRSQGGQLGGERLGAPRRSWRARARAARPPRCRKQALGLDLADGAQALHLGLGGLRALHGRRGRDPGLLQRLLRSDARGTGLRQPSDQAVDSVARDTCRLCCPVLGLASRFSTTALRLTAPSVVRCASSISACARASRSSLSVSCCSVSVSRSSVSLSRCSVSVSRCSLSASWSRLASWRASLSSRAVYQTRS